MYNGVASILEQLSQTIISAAKKAKKTKGKYKEKQPVLLKILLIHLCDLTTLLFVAAFGSCNLRESKTNDFDFDEPIAVHIRHLKRFPVAGCLLKNTFFRAKTMTLFLIPVFRSCPSTFDESIMFTDPVKSRGLKVFLENYKYTLILIPQRYTVFPFDVLHIKILHPFRRNFERNFVTSRE